MTDLSSGKTSSVVPFDLRRSRNKALVPSWVLHSSEWLAESLRKISGVDPVVDAIEPHGARYRVYMHLILPTERRRFSYVYLLALENEQVGFVMEESTNVAIH